MSKNEGSLIGYRGYLYPKLWLREGQKLERRRQVKRRVKSLGLQKSSVLEGASSTAMVPAQMLSGVSTSHQGVSFSPVWRLPLKVRFKGSDPQGFPSDVKSRKRITRFVDGRIVCVSAGNEVQSSDAQGGRESIFGVEQKLPVHLRFVKDWTAPTRYVACTFLVASAVASGYAVGRTTKATPAAILGCALAVGAVGGLSAFALNSTAPNVAAVQLHNALVNHPDPKSLTQEEVDSIVQR